MLRPRAIRDPADAESEQKDIAKYFVPPSTIRGFIPTEYRLFRGDVTFSRHHDCPRRLGYFSWHIRDAAAKLIIRAPSPPSVRQPRSYPIIFSRQQAIDYVESDAVPVELRATKH